MRTGDELEALGSAFNEMARGLEERERIRRTFERYVSKEVADEVLRHPELAAPRGVRRELTIVFFDLGGFTALAERLAPETLVERLNEYFEVVGEAVLAEGGTLNQFEGDGVLAFWGAPVPDRDHARRACAAALRALGVLETLSARWRAAGLPGLRARVGIHSGVCVVGEIGSSERRTYASVGDPVNLASRLEGVNKLYGTRVVASEAAVRAAGDAVAARELDWIRVAGRRDPVRIFEIAPREAGAARARLWALYAEGLEAWREGRLEAARKAFGEAAAAAPDDGPTRTFLARLDALGPGGAPEGWSPVHEAASK